ncbi:uncharacterized protein LOC114641785 [Erpetoichthys calabaricus]|uniref:uncharacterized protein LOC114641785 n=1 Tax=Erpetoichthys calabaricus TaxID=27687 RepID=UPI00109EEF49|nr:uncharacterized protein LOC114641785 [Erpetoichthys calabaricus]
MASTKDEEMDARLEPFKQEYCEWGASMNVCVKTEDWEGAISDFKEEEFEKNVEIKGEDAGDLPITLEQQKHETGNIESQGMWDETHSSLQPQCASAGQLLCRQDSKDLNSALPEFEEKVTDGNRIDDEGQQSSRKVGMSRHFLLGDSKVKICRRVFFRRHPVLDESLYFRGGDELLEPEEYKKLDSSIECEIPCELQASIVEEDVQEFFLQVKKKKAKTRKKCRGRSKHQKCCNPKTSERLKKECPMLYCEARVVHLPRHLREIHGWPKERAQSAVQAFMLRKPYTTTKSNKRKAKDYHYCRPCPVDGCFSVVKRLPPHLRKVHQIASDSKQYKMLLSSVSRRNKQNKWSLSDRPDLSGHVTSDRNGDDNGRERVESAGRGNREETGGRAMAESEESDTDVDYARRHPVLDESLDFHGGDELLDPEEYKELDSSIECAIPCELQASIVEEDVQEFFLQVKKKKANTRKKCPGRSKHQKCCNPKTSKRLKKECPVLYCEARVVHLPRHLRDIHGWPKERAQSAVQAFMLRKPYTTTKSNKRKAKDYHYCRPCPVDGCFSVVKRLPPHLRKVHQIASDSEQYKRLLSSVSRRKNKWSLSDRLDLSGHVTSDRNGDDDDGREGVELAGRGNREETGGRAMAESEESDTDVDYARYTGGDPLRFLVF